MEKSKNTITKIYRISHDTLLGKVPDIVIARKYKVSNSRVALIRRKLKIKASHKHDSDYTNFRRKISLSILKKKVIPILGNYSDAEIGRKYGVTRERIRQFRKKIGVHVYIKERKEVK
jgi:hypothetical protein